MMYLPTYLTNEKFIFKYQGINFSLFSSSPETKTENTVTLSKV